MGIATKKTDGNVVIVKALVDTVVGDVVAFSTHSIGVAQTAGLTGVDISVDTRGAFELPADVTEAFVVGDQVNWDTSSKICISTGSVLAGTVIEGKSGSVDAPILVKIG